MSEQPAGKQDYSVLKPAGHRLPCPAVHIETQEDIQTAIKKLDTGYHTARLIRALASRCAAFFYALEPEDFALFAKALYDALMDKRNAPTVRMAAAQGATMMLQKLAGLVPAIARYNNPVVMDQMYRCVMAFFDVFTDERYAEIPAAVRALMSKRVTRLSSARVRIAKRMLTTSCEILSVLAELQQEKENTSGMMYRADNPDLIATKKELKELVDGLKKELKDEKAKLA